MKIYAATLWVAASVLCSWKAMDDVQKHHDDSVYFVGFATFFFWPAFMAAFCFARLVEKREVMAKDTK